MEKYCINCIHLIKDNGKEECFHESNRGTNLVNGLTFYKKSPHDLRYGVNFNSCGSNGLWWQSKEPASPF